MDRNEPSMKTTNALGPPDAAFLFWVVSVGAGLAIDKAVGDEREGRRTFIVESRDVGPVVFAAFEALREVGT